MTNPDRECAVFLENGNSAKKPTGETKKTESDS